MSQLPLHDARTAAASATGHGTGPARDDANRVAGGTRAGVRRRPAGVRVRSGGAMRLRRSQQEKRRARPKPGGPF
jgi:hypothetical protein